MPEEKIPLGQRFYDSIFILFILSNLITLFSYDIWGMLDLRLVTWVK
ncbi:MAG: hypothetical protein HZA07_02600 [Nitrospirae bacterium]|nr:hypothetical protein [Nitrospirota bacterium]